jgi:N-acetyl sugar amidotransferase
MKYCKSCVMPPTRPGLVLDEFGVCNACRWYEKKKTAIDWETRRQELQLIADEAKARSVGPWDCVVGVSGGKDSTWQAVYVRDKLGLNPLLVQFACSDGTDVGRENLENLVEMGFSLVSVQPNPVVARKLCRKSFFTYGNIVKYSEHALFTAPFRVAIDYNIPLVFFGENPALEVGDRNTDRPGWDATGIQFNNTLGGQGIDIWVGDGITERDLLPYAFPSDAEMQAWGGRGIFMGYFLDWSGWENGVFALENGFKCVDFDYRDIGIPYQHNSIDSFNGGFVNAMLKHIKLGFGHTSEFTSYDVRAGRLTRPQAIRLVKELDGKCSPKLIQEYCDWIGITPEQFWEVANSFRGSMWEKNEEGQWVLDDPIWEQFSFEETASLEELVAIIDPRLKMKPKGGV